VFFALGGYSKKRDEFLMVTKVESDPDLKKLYFNVINDMENERDEFSLEKKILLYLLSLRPKNKEELLTKTEKKIFHSVDESIQEMFTDIGYVAPGQMSEKPVPLKQDKLNHNKVKEQPEISPTVLQRPQSRWEWFWNYINKIILGMPQSG
jgi:hypothetical protein